VKAFKGKESGLPSLNIGEENRQGTTRSGGKDLTRRTQGMAKTVTVREMPPEGVVFSKEKNPGETQTGG